ncbi:MAG: LuxR C-terminal-related transcriptional regulator [Mycobacteriales bacterium]
MDVMMLNQAAGALEVAAAYAHPLRDEAFVEALLALIPCEGISLNDLDVTHQRSAELDVVPWPSDQEGSGFWEHFWSSAPCSFTERGGPLAHAPCATTDFYDVREWHATGMYAEFMRPAGIEWDLVLPLPGPTGISRRLIFFRGPGRSFDEREKAAARVLAPHVVEALRRHARQQAAEALTPRQRELLCLCAQGLDNTRIARRLGMSVGTVRKHLENAFGRLGVTSRSEAVASVLPDLNWT